MNFVKLGIKGNICNVIQGILQRLRANITFNKELLEAPNLLRKKMALPLLLLLFPIVILFQQIKNNVNIRRGENTCVAIIIFQVQGGVN